MATLIIHNKPTLITKTIRTKATMTSIKTISSSTVVMATTTSRMSLASMIY